MDHDLDGDFDEEGSPPGQTTYEEWLHSPYPAQGVQCQTCHMPSPDEGPVQIAVFGGADRVLGQYHSHRFEGTTLAFLKSAVELVLEASRTGEELNARVDVTNVGAGHNFPTGVSIRNALLVVSARTDSTTAIPWLSGTSLVPEWGGVGDATDDYGGKPGRGFAKVLRGRNGQERVLFIDAIELAGNTQIPPKATDRSRYRFDLNGVETEDALIEARLIYRRAWKDLAETKGWIGGVDGQGYSYGGDLLVDSAALVVPVDAPAVTPSPTPVYPTPVPRLDPAVLLDLLETWKQGTGGSPMELLIQQAKWYSAGN